MTEWTQTVQRDGVEFSMNALKTHVKVSTIHGSYTEKVEVIRQKLQDQMLLPAVRSMFESMMKYYEENKEDEPVIH